MAKGIITVDEVIDPLFLNRIKEAENAVINLHKALNDLPEWVKNRLIE